MVLFSADPAHPNSLERSAHLLGTIPYELTCGLHRRMARLYRSSDAAPNG
jgi:alanine racemase